VFSYLEAPAKRVASPNVPAPVCSTLERLFYPGSDEIAAAAFEVVSGKPALALAQYSHPLRPLDEDFHGPF